MKKTTPIYPHSSPKDKVAQNQLQDASTDFLAKMINSSGIDRKFFLTAPALFPKLIFSIHNNSLVFFDDQIGGWGIFLDVRQDPH